MSEQGETDDDDWFEQGLREARQSADSTEEETEWDDAFDAANDEFSDPQTGDSGSGGEDDSGQEQKGDSSQEQKGDSSQEQDDASDSDSWMTEVESESEPATTEDDPWSAEEDTSATGTDVTDDPFGSSGTEGFGEEMAAAGSEASERSSSWADAASGDSESLFDDEGFGGAFESAGGGDEEFSDEDFESEIPRLDLGIEGLDQMIQGGIPRRHLIVAIGGAGTGKTTFGLQFLHHGLQQGEKGVFITLEQSHEAIIATGNEWGWDFAEYEDKDMLAIVDLDPVEMANSLDNIQAELPTLIQDFGADRLVLDSVSLLEMMYDNVAKRRTEIFDFTRALKKAGVTTFLTSEASETNPYSSRHGIIEYLTDAVFVLRYIRGDMQETRLAVEIQKIRNANHSRETKPYDLTDEGISVYRQANIF